MSESIPHVVQRVAFLDIQHPTRDAVAQRVGAQIRRLFPQPVGEVRSHAGGRGDPRHHVPGRLRRHVVRQVRREHPVGVRPPGRKMRRDESLDVTR